MPEEILQEENPIYKFMKSNNLTDLNEGEFLTKYSAPNKAKEIHSFMVSNKLTDLDESKFYDSYLKKKDQGVLPSVSSPTQSLSPDFKKGKAFAEKGFLMKPEGTKEIIETPDSQQQGLLLNLVSSLDKGFAKNFISSPIKGLGTVLQGTTKKVLGGTGEGYISDKLIKLGDYLNNAIDEVTPQDEEFKNTLWDQAGQAVGQIGSLVLTGGLTGAAGKGAALVSQAPKGAAITAVKTLGSQLSSPTAISAGLSMGQAEFDRAIQAGATDDQAFEAFYKNAVTGSVLETVPVMQFFKRFNKSTAGSVANYIKTKGVAGLTGGIEEMTTEVMQQIYANKTAKDIYNINQDILDGVGSSGGIGFGIGFLLNAMGANAKILRKQGKVQEADVLENQVKQYEDNLENPKVTSGNKVSAKDIVTQGPEIGTQKAVRNLDRDLANNVITPEQYQEGINFVEKAAQVADKIPEIVTGESRIKSVELLVERNDIKQANDNLIQQKQITDEAYHAGIDEEIKANEEKIKKVDAEVYNIAKKPSKDFGDKKYIVDGEEVSKEAFEALQGKPIGTKTIIEPTEIGGLKVIKRAPDAPNGEAVYEVEGERFMTADGKELGVAKVEIPKQETKPAEVKVTEVKPAEVKAEATPTKELSEGESVEFKTPEGNKVVGEKVIIPGFEKMDMVMVKKGLNNIVYDLASGMPISEGDFTKEGTIKSIKDDFEARNITQDKLYGLIYKSTNASSFEMNKNRVPQINPSSMFESYSEKRKAFDKAEYEKLPLKYTPKEIEGLNKLRDKAKENGLNKLAAEIEEKAKERFKEGSYKPPYDFFDKQIKSEIEQKTKEEAENNKVPYPKEFIKTFPNVTEDYLKKMVNSGYKVDKFAKIPSDVKKVMIDGLQLSRDFMNKYGYHPYEQSDNFFTKLLYFMNSTGARENRESKIIESKKELVSALDDLNKVHEKEFGKKEKPAEPNEKELGQRQVPEGKGSWRAEFNKETDIFRKSSILRAIADIGSSENEIYDIIDAAKSMPEESNIVYSAELALKRIAKVEKIKPSEVKIEDDLKKAEAKFAAAEDRFKKARNKIEATQVKQAGIFGGEQKGMFAMGGEEAKSTLDPLRKAAKEAKAELDDIRNRIKVQEVAQPELAPVKTDAREEAYKFIKNNYIQLKDPEGRIINYAGKIRKTGFKEKGKEVLQITSIDGNSYLNFIIDKGEIKQISGNIYAEGKDEIKLTQKVELEKLPVYKSTDIKELKNDRDFNTSGYPESFVKIFTDLKTVNKSARILRGNEYITGMPKVGDKVIIFNKNYVIVTINNDKNSKIDLYQINNDNNFIRESDKIEKEAAPKKTYQEAVKEKLEAEKKLTKKIAGEKAAVTKEIYRKVNMMDEPRDAEEAALRYLAGGGKIRDEDINDVYGRVKRAELNTGRRELKTTEVKSKDFGGGKEKISDIAHRIWEDSGQEISEKAAEEALMSEIGNNNTRLEAAEAYLEKYSPEYLEEKNYQRQAEESEAQILEAEQKAAETNEKIKEEFKEVIGKASKKAKENAKIEFVDRNFEYLKQKIKIEEKCPF